MRDLYHRLDIPRHATPDTIARAAARCANQTLQADAKSVLGIDAHREVYDELHGLLSDLGQLRAGLGMTHAPHWCGDVANDFSPPPERIVSRQAQLTAKLEIALARHQSRQRRRGWFALVTLAALSTAYAAGRFWS
ncbi:hypothetical protein [Phytohalomonas tamaricis]|uniref:hypothetical protein n=1 Tax=Phytohalomonas tamaricis TaxID=2081032 RepID=UPI000D0BBF39|nr:hypothetical protein [Phytohalomonas tamaricis]